MPLAELVADEIRLAVRERFTAVPASSLTAVSALDCIRRRCPENPDGGAILDALHRELSDRVAAMPSGAGQDPRKAALRELLTLRVGLTSRKMRAAARLGMARRSLDRPAPGADRTRYADLMDAFAGLLLTEPPDRSATRPPPPRRPSFPSWLDSVIGQPIDAGAAVRVGPPDLIWARLDDAAAFHIAHSGQLVRVNLREHPAVGPPFLLDGRWADDWTNQAAKLQARFREAGEPDGVKVSVDAMTLPLLDVPTLTITWHREPYSVARSFQRTLQTAPELWQDLAPRAADLAAQPRWPSVLCLHFVGCFTDADGTLCVLIARRQKRTHAGGFYGGRWSVSFEEQVEPGERFDESVTRALEQEVLGPEAARCATSRYAAAIIEQSILNVAVIVITDIALTFSQIHDHWAKASTDRSENSQIAAIPLTAEVFRALSRQDHQALRESVRVSSGSPIPDKIDLHPTGLFRYALAQWEMSGAG